MKTKRGLILFLWLLVLAIAAMIFFFSSQDGAESMKTSAGLTQWLVHLFYPNYDQLPAAEKLRIWNQFVYIARKGAHFTEFAMLGTSLRMLFQALGLRWAAGLSWLAGTLYACTDEWHQSLLGTRSGMIRDVGIDSAGVLFGVLAVTLILYLSRRRKGRGGVACYSP